MQRKGRINWVAVLAGWILDFVLSLIISGVALAFDPSLEEASFFASASGIVTGLLLALATGIGGWLAGRIAKEERVLHGVLVGGLGIFLLLLVSLTDTPPPLDSILLQLLATALGGLGGYLSRWTPVRQQEE